MLKKIVFLLVFVFVLNIAHAQCSMCTKTAASLDDNAARGLNTGILYLALLPMTMMGFMAYKVWKNQKGSNV